MATSRTPPPPLTHRCLQDCFSDIEICEQGRQPCVLFDKNAKELGMLQDENPSAIYCCMCFGACEWAACRLPLWGKEADVTGCHCNIPEHERLRLLLRACPLPLQMVCAA